MTREPRNWIDDHAHQWSEAGLISEQQAAAILRYEAEGEHAEPQRLSIVAEVAAYLGSVLALMGGVAVVGPNWDELGVGGRMAVALAVMFVGFAAGSWLINFDERATGRLGSFLWVIGTGGMAMAVGVAMSEVDPRDAAWTLLAVGAPVLVVGLALWRNRDRPLQLLTFAAGVGMTLGAVGDLTDTEPWVGGAALVVLGTLFALVAGFHRLTPRLVALVTGAFGAYVGGFLLGELNDHLGPAAAVVVAMAVVTFALAERTMPVLAIGVVGALIATWEILRTTFDGVMASTIVTLIGLAIVILVIERARRSGLGKA
jgi:hypothetical protein